jgi:hypothetical protein
MLSACRIQLRHTFDDEPLVPDALLCHFAHPIDVVRSALPDARRSPPCRSFTSLRGMRAASSADRYARRICSGPIARGTRSAPLRQLLLLLSPLRRPYLPESQPVHLCFCFDGVMAEHTH